METADGDKSKSTVIDVKAPEDYDDATHSGTYVNTYSVFGSGLYDGWTFFVELLNYNPDTGEYLHSAYLPGHGYDELVSSRALVMDYMVPTGMMAGNAFSFSAIPEPSSGLMLLLGLAALGLKRRRLSGTPQGLTPLVHSHRNGQDARCPSCVSQRAGSWCFAASPSLASARLGESTALPPLTRRLCALRGQSFAFAHVRPGAAP